MGILTYTAELSERNIFLDCSDGENLLTSNWNDLVGFLLKECEFACVWNIDEFVSTIAEFFPKQTRKDLLEKGGRVLLENVRLWYQPNREFTLTYNHVEVTFYGLSRYSDKRPDNIQSLYKLALDVIDAYKEGFGIEHPKLSSPVAAYGEVLDSLSFPRACNLPSKAMPMIEQASNIMTRCEWRQTYQIGHWNNGEIFDIDGNAAYPGVMAQLPDISDAKFFESDKLEPCSFGILQGDLNVVKDVSPFASDDGIYRKGLHKDYVITTGQHYLLKYGGDFKIKHGWYLQLPPKYKLPFKSTMTSLYESRGSNNIYIRKIAKGISVGVWGMLCQRYPKDDGWKLGKSFNSIYGLMVSSKNACKVADLIYKYNLDSAIVSITVDGILSTVKPPIEYSKIMGQWKLNEPSPALVLSQLYQWLADKKPNMKYYSEMVDMINKNPKSVIYDNIDFNLLEHDRIFPKLPKNGGELLANHYTSIPHEIE